jgi:hypothetical protein
MYGCAVVEPDPMSVFALAEAGVSSASVSAAAKPSLLRVIFDPSPFATGMATGGMSLIPVDNARFVSRA